MWRVAWRQGTAGDWAKLRQHAEQLITRRCDAPWAARWLQSLLPLLDKLAHEYQRAAAAQGDRRAGDELFWNSMCKRGGTSGSGARSWFNGWFNIFFPDILGRPNPYCVPYAPTNGYVTEGRNGGLYSLGGLGIPDGVQGPDCADFPSGMAAAPLTWQYFSEECKLMCRAGFVGAAQDADGTVRPVLAWFVCHDSAALSVIDAEPGSAPIASPLTRERCAEWLHKVPCLAPLRADPRNMKRLVKVLEERVYAAGEQIVTEGKECPYLCLIIAGEAVITKAGHEGELARRGVGDYFGETALFGKAGPIAASVAACEASGCTLARLSRDNFARQFTGVFK